MALSLILNLSALAALLLAVLVAYRVGESGGRTFWAALLLATAATLIYAVAQLAASWQTGLSVALWLSVTVTLVLYLPHCRLQPAAVRLAPLLLPYLLLLALAGTAMPSAEGAPLDAAGPAAWIVAHVAASLLTYGLVTLAAMAGLAVFIQQHAVKRKRPSRLSRLLPAIAESEQMQMFLLMASVVVLGLGLVTGMTLQLYGFGAILIIDHKSLLSIAAFVLIALLLLAHAHFGVQGKLAARLVLVAYLLLTLAYPGVKFVTGVLIG